MKTFPQKLTAFNVYDDGQILIGTDAEIELPNFESITSTISGSGIMGEIDTPTVGHFPSMKLPISFRTICEESSKISEPRVQNITLRGDVSYGDSLRIQHKPMKVTVTGMPTSFTTGKLKAGEGMGTQVSIEIYYIKIELDGKTVIELDKFAYIYIVNGYDYYAEVRNNI